MFGVTQKEVKRLRQQYPKGTRLKLISMEDPHGVPEGTVGAVDFIDDKNTSPAKHAQHHTEKTE